MTSRGSCWGPSWLVSREQWVGMATQHGLQYIHVYSRRVQVAVNAPALQVADMMNAGRTE